MFAHASDASKVAFVWLMKQLTAWGVELIDCQVYTDHLSRFGAENIARREYLRVIGPLVRAKRVHKKFQFEEGFFPL